MTEPVDSPRQQLREAIAKALWDDAHPPQHEAAWSTIVAAPDASDLAFYARHYRGKADAVLAALVEAGRGPTAAHEACIKRLRAGWRWEIGLDDDGPRWEKGIGWDYRSEPMTEAEQEVMSRG